MTGKGIPGVVIDVWEDSTNGLYEQQDPEQEDLNLRGRFTTDEEGRYSWYCLKPTPYPVPFDGPAGKVLQLLDRHPMRPAHIHLIVSPSFSNPSYSAPLSDALADHTLGVYAHHYADL